MHLEANIIQQAIYLSCPLYLLFFMYFLLQVFYVLLPYFPLVLLSLQAEEGTAPGLKA